MRPGRWILPLLFLSTLAHAAEWRTYRNTRYRYRIDYPPDAEIAAEDQNSNSAESATLSQAASILITFPMSYPTDQGAPQPVIVHDVYGLRVHAEGNPQKFSAEEWVGSYPQDDEKARHKITLAGQPALKVRRWAGDADEVCVYAAAASLYALCMNGPGPEATEAVKTSAQQTFDRMLASFKIQ